MKNAQTKQRSFSQKYSYDGKTNLIQDAGLKGYTVGGAQVSEKHSGFVVNRGGATAEEVAFLIKQVQKKVMKQFNVMMQPEVRFVGFADTEVRE